MNQNKNTYELLDFNLDAPSQMVQFYSLNQDGTHENGTTVENVLEVGLARLKDLHENFPCRENSLAITKIEEAIMWLEARTQDRLKRGVEGLHKP